MLDVNSMMHKDKEILTKDLDDLNDKLREVEVDRDVALKEKDNVEAVVEEAKL